MKLTPEIKAEITRQYDEREKLTATTNIAIREEVEERFEHPPESFVTRIELAVETKIRHHLKYLTIILAILLSVAGFYGYSGIHSIPGIIRTELQEDHILPAITNVVRENARRITDDVILQQVKAQITLNIKDITSTIATLNAIAVSNQASLAKMNLAIEFQSIVGRALGYDYNAYTNLTSDVYTNVMDKGLTQQLWGAIGQKVFADINTANALWCSVPPGRALAGVPILDSSKFSIEDYRNYFKGPFAISPFVRAQTLIEIFLEKRFSERERFDFMVWVLGYDNNCLVLQEACLLMNSKRQGTANFVGKDDFVKWYSSNSNDPSLFSTNVPVIISTNVTPGVTNAPSK